MIVGLGIDLLRHSRVRKELARAPWSAADGVFTPAEIHFCNSRPAPWRHYAACFAAKEAAIKALGVQLCDLALLREAEWLPSGKSKPAVRMCGRLKVACSRMGVRRVWASVTRSKTQTAAMVVLEN